jgi:hypothetical protein
MVIGIMGHGLESRTTGQDRLTTTTSTASTVWVHGGGNCAGGCYRQGDAPNVDDFASVHILKDLLTDALLTCLVEVAKVCGPEILPFVGVCPMTFLVIRLHTVNVLLSVFTHARIVSVCT